MCADNLTPLFDKLHCQFLCCFALDQIDWQQIPSTLSWEQQKQLIDVTYAHALNKEFSIKLSYQLNFLKRLYQLLEQNCDEVHDCVYEAYCEVQQQLAQDACQKYAYKHYILPAHQTHFTLRESKSFVTQGTTGLISWQASLALADYLLQQPQLLQNANVLELGAGTGLCGFIISQCCAPKQVLLTDGSADCVQLMRENSRRNFAHAKELEENCFQINEQQSLLLQQLSWEERQDWTQILKPNLLLSADVVYDDSVFEHLCQTIEDVFDYANPELKMLLAATVRNEQTLHKFLQLLGKLNFNIEEQPIVAAEQSHLHWNRSTPVKMFLITKS